MLNLVLLFVFLVGGMLINIWNASKSRFPVEKTTWNFCMEKTFRKWTRILVEDVDYSKKVHSYNFFFNYIQLNIILTFPFDVVVFFLGLQPQVIQLSQLLL